MSKVLFNGAIFATGRKDGIPRCAMEIIKQMDKIETNFSMEIVSPVKLEIELDNIQVTILHSEIFKCNKFGAELWKQFCFVNYANKVKCIVVDLGMMLPFRRNDICSIYDCQPEKYFRNYIIHWYSKYLNIFRLKQRKNAILHSKMIITDSEYAKQDIIKYYNVDEKKIKVIYCAWQHFEDIVPDYEVLNEFEKIKESQFFFSLGSRFKHKNIEWIFSAAEQNSEYNFVVTGYNNVAEYSSEIIKEAPQNVIFTGYLSDEKVKALMIKCKAFIHPSFSEGFGIPPLEALSCGAELILSNATCLPEIYKNCAHYINPNQYKDIDIIRILSSQVGNSEELLNYYSWEKSAYTLVGFIENLLRSNHE